MSLSTRINEVRVSDLVSNTHCSIQFGRHKCKPSTFTHLYLIFMPLERQLLFSYPFYYQFYYYHLYVFYLNCLCFPNGEFAGQKKSSQEN